MPTRRCGRCRRPLTGRRRRWCDTCAPRDWRGAGAKAVIAQVRDRAARGERCHFYRQPGHDQCPGEIDLTLDGNRDRWAFTVHHLHRRMHGGPAVPHATLVAPAHRACNARDGLYAQNARRGYTSRAVVVAVRERAVAPMPTSEDW